MSRSQIEQRYGVPLPIDVLWRELEQRYGAEVVIELQGLYRSHSELVALARQEVSL